MFTDNLITITLNSNGAYTQDSTNITDHTKSINAETIRQTECDIPTKDTNDLLGETALHHASGM